MKKFSTTVLLSFLFLLSPNLAAAQHTVGLSAQPSATVGISSYNVYRAPCTTVVSGVCSVGEGVFVKIGSAAVGATIIYTDSTVKGGSNYSYYFTAVCPTAGCGTDASGNLIAGESGASNHVGAAIPATPPLPPGNLSITNVARNSTGANTTLSAHWMDAPGVPTSYSFFANGVILTSGSLTNNTGSYSAVWSGKVKPGSSITFEVCDSNGACQSKLI
jgi:hypothetical protein